MPVQKIPREDWAAFAESFGLQHENWPAGLQVEPAENTARLERLADQLPLRGFALVRSPDCDSFWVALGEGPYQAVHHVAEPTRVEILTDDDGAHEGLRIDSSSGETLHLHFRASTRPEELDEIE